MESIQNVDEPDQQALDIPPSSWFPGLRSYAAEIQNDPVIGADGKKT